MALAFVGTAGTGTGDGGATSIAAGAKAHTAGNLIVVQVAWTHATGSVSSVTDTAGNTYTLVTSSRVNHTNDHLETYIAKNITGNAANVVTANLSASSTFRRIIVHEYSGADTAAPGDQVATGTATAAASVTSATMNTTVANEVLVAAMSSTGGGSSVTAGTGYTARVTALGSDTSSEDRIVAATGAYTGSFTWTGSQDAWLTASSFKQASTGGQTVSVTGLGSVASLGAVTPRPGNVNVSVTGLGSAAAFGAVSALPGNVIVPITGLGSAAAFGSPVLPQTVPVAGLGSAAAFGPPSVSGGAGPTFDPAVHGSKHY